MQSRRIALAALIVVVIAILACQARARRDSFSSYQFWSWDPARGSPPLQNPWEYRSTLFRQAMPSGECSPYKQLQVSAAFQSEPKDGSENFRGWRHPWEFPRRYQTDRAPYPYYAPTYYYPRYFGSPWL